MFQDDQECQWDLVNSKDRAEGTISYAKPNPWRSFKATRKRCKNNFVVYRLKGGNSSYIDDHTCSWDPEHFELSSIKGSIIDPLRLLGLVHCVPKKITFYLIGVRYSNMIFLFSLSKRKRTEEPDQACQVVRRRIFTC